jgi:uncharacterized protein with beta-barrel porin domain
MKNKGEIAMSKNGKGANKGPGAGSEMKALVAEVAAEVQAEVQTVEVREGFEIVDGTLQMLPMGPNPGIDELVVAEAQQPVIEETTTLTETQTEGKITEVIEVDPVAAQMETLKALVAGTAYEGLVNDIGTFLVEHAAITGSAEEILANEKDPKALHASLVKRSEGLKAVNTRVRAAFSTMTQQCIGVDGSIADRAVQQRRNLFETKAETPKEEAGTAAK